MLWLDGELPPEKAGEFQSHIEECPHCRKAIEAQQRMEKLWRGSWKDPDETAFTMMRKGLSGAVPWWRRQRSWMAVAAVFAVYFGVRLFLVDEQGTSMSHLVQEELLNGADDAPGHVYNEPEVVVTAQAETCEEQEEEMAACEPQEEITEEFTAGETWAAPVETADEQLDVCLNLSEDMEGLSMEVEQMEEPVGFVAYNDQEDMGSEFPADIEGTSGFGVCGGSSVGAGGGGSGGLTATESSSDATLHEEENQDAVTVGDAVCEVTRMASCQDCPSSTAKDSVLYFVSAELATGETVVLSRGNWISLFQLIDNYIDQYEVTCRTLCLSIDSTGTVSGEELMDGSVIDEPPSEYADCSVTVSIY